MFVVLSGRVGPDHLVGASPGDIIVVGPGVEADLPSGIQARKVPLASDRELRLLASKLAEELGKTPSGNGRDLVECVLNDGYAYALRPAYSTYECLRKIVEEEGVDRIVLIACRRIGRGLPLVGFRTTESPRGSGDLLGAYIAQMVVGAFPGVSVEMTEVKGDLLCVDLVRKAFMVCANLFFIALFSLKCLLFLRRGRLAAGQIAHGLIVRVPHQARFATRLLSGRPDAVVFAFPQASQGSLRFFRRMLRDDLAGCSVEPVRLGGLLRAAAQTVRDLRALRRFARTSFNVSVSGQDGAPHIDLSDLARELMIFPILLFYKNVLVGSIAASGCRKLVNFELVGRMAGLESLVARRGGIPSITVQTALVSATPHVVFPWSTLFLTDGPEVAKQLEGIGAIGYGEVRYAGSAFTLEGAREADEAREIGFFTQPYESTVTLAMLELLCEDAREFGRRIHLKLHPRDDERRYRDLVARNGDVLIPASCRTDLLLNRVDLCVTRTSSVAKEAIASGTPVVLCLWTKTDRSIRADYVRPGSEWKYCSFGMEDLRSIIANYSELRRAADELGRCLFGGLGIENLRAALFEGGSSVCADA
jgi:hypothetical protein